MYYNVYPAVEGGAHMLNSSASRLRADPSESCSERWPSGFLCTTHMLNMSLRLPSIAPS